MIIKKNRAKALFFLCFGFEILFADAADGAAPVVGKIFESGARGYAVIGIALGGVIHVTADFANVLFHKR